MLRSILSLMRPTRPFPFVPVRRALLVLSLVAAGTACKRAHAPAEAAQPPAAKTVKVTSAPATLQEAPTWLLLAGQLKGGHQTDLAANVSGRITSLKVERGAVVKIGDPIALVDVRAASLSATEARAQAANAKASADAAKLDCERAKVLGATGSISKAELDRLEAQCRSTELMVSAMDARAQLAAQNVGDGVIRAPFSGSISERYVDVGAYVQKETKVVSIVEVDQLRLETAIPEASIAFAKPGAKIRFSVAGYPDRFFDGTLRYVAASVRQATRDIVSEAVVEDPEGILRSGMFASVRLQQSTAKLPAIPAQAIVKRDGKAAAFVVASNRVELRFLQTGDPLPGDVVSILRGVAEGDKVVIAPPADLANGQAVD